MKSISVVILLYLTHFSGVLQAQTLDRYQPIVFDNGVELINAWAGGLNSPQISDVDLNNDGLMDLYVFDKTADFSIPFLNVGALGNPIYKFDPAYISSFPKLNDWVLLRDYDNDGIKDIFAQSNILAVQGIQAYKGKYVNNKIEFDLIPTSEGSFNVLYVQQSNGSFTQVFISPDDYPAVDDIDGDGDLDILTFSQGGGQIYYYSNLSMQRGFGRDSFKFIRTDICWGDAYETGVEPCLNLSGSPDTCALGFNGDDPLDRSGVHVGSTLMTFDSDNDGDKEVVLGDLSFNSLIYCENGGSQNNSWIVDQDCYYPSYNTSADISSFPTAFYVDVDGDNLNDLLAAPNLSVSRGEDLDALWYYKNTTSNEFPSFDLRQKDFLIDKMIDIGTASHPIFIDYNGDGLQDLLIGSETQFDPIKPINPFFTLYENTGSADSPRFIKVNNDWLSFNDRVGSQNYDLHPTFADMDGDGDLDILVGEASGALFYGENIAGPGNGVQIQDFVYPYMNIDIGSFSTPTVIDLNRDGLLDLVIGESRGKLNYFQNTGTNQSPQFSSTASNEFLGEVDVREFGFSEGFSDPVFIDQGGQYILFCGSLSGTVFHYEGIEGNLNSGQRFTKIDTVYGGINEGAKSRIDFADINNDDILELVVGNRRGGLSLFHSNYKTDGTLGLNSDYEFKDFVVSPNPTRDWINIILPAYEEGELSIYDLQGRILSSSYFSGTTTKLNVNGFKSGLYFIELKAGGAIYQGRFIKQ